MKIVRKLMFTLFLSVVYVVCAYGQVSYQRDRCVSLGRESAAALNSQDYLGLKNISDWGIANCRAYLPLEIYYELYGTQSLAREEMGDPRGALKVAESCVAQKYDIIDCHVHKYSALLRLGRNSDAQREKGITLNLINNRLEELSQTGTNREYSQALRAKLEAQRDFLTR